MSVLAKIMSEVLSSGKTRNLNHQEIEAFKVEFYNETKQQILKIKAEFALAQAKNRNLVVD